MLLLGAAAGLGAATVCAVMLLLALSMLRFFGFFGMLLFGGLYGYVVSEAVSRSTNRKRGPVLIWTTIATLAAGLGLARAIVAYAQLASRGGLDEGARLARALAAGFSPDLGVLLLLLVAAAITYNRLR